jgi:two-component system, OmpR family, alkaline phosphatase synthesis response regulator PhoP
MAKKRILMIEDEPGLVLSVGDRLLKEGYDFDSANDGENGLRKALHGSFDIALVDLMLPGKSGFDIVREIRASGSKMPLLLVTAKDQLTDKISGLRMGADDYVVKPFAMEELVARVEVQLRRSEELARMTDPGADTAGPGAASSGESDKTWLDTSKAPFSFGPFTVDYQRATLLKDGANMQLSHQEFKLLCLFVERKGVVLDGDTLLNLAWGYGSEVTSRTLYVHIAWLRKKLRSAGEPEGYIRTVRRLGYLFTA